MYYLLLYQYTAHDCYCVKGLWCCFPKPSLIFIYSLMGLLIYKYEPLWQEVSVKSLLLPVGFLFINVIISCWIYFLNHLHTFINRIHVLFGWPFLHLRLIIAEIDTMTTTSLPNETDNRTTCSNVQRGQHKRMSVIVSLTIGLAGLALVLLVLYLYVNTIQVKIRFT